MSVAFPIRLPAVALAAMLAAVSPPSVSATETTRTTTAVEATLAADTYRLDLAARLRLLSQQMAQDACLATIGIDPDGRVTEMRRAHALFTESVTALERGSLELWLLPETDARVIEQVRNFAATWRPYAAEVADVADRLSAGSGSLDLAPLYEASVSVLVSSDDMMATLEQKYERASDLRPGLASAITVAGRQRLLVEKMVKEACLLAAGHAVETTRAQLIGTLALYRSSHEQLRHRFRGLSLPAGHTGRVAEATAAVEQLWAEVEPVYARIAGGARPGVPDVRLILAGGPKVAAALDRVATLYAAGG